MPLNNLVVMPNANLVELFRFPPAFKRETESMVTLMSSQGFRATISTDAHTREVLLRLPAIQVEQLRALQREHPERWGTAFLVPDTLPDAQDAAYQCRARA